MTPRGPRESAGGRPPSGHEHRVAAIGAIVLGFIALMAVALIVVVVRGVGSASVAGNAAPADPWAVDPATYAYARVREAPPIDLTDQDGNPFELASLRGRPVLVYFGYTHCPDVCPTSIGVINEALAATGPGPRVLFVTIDPDRDDVAAMKSYLRYLPAGYVGLSGTPEDIRRVADAWGVQYAKIETGSAAGYAMGHSSDVFLVDAAGQLRAAFPFGIDAEPVAAALQDLLAEVPPPSEPPATPMPTIGTEPSAPPAATATPVSSAAPTSTPAPGGSPSGLALYPKLVTTSIWSGGSSPVIVTIRDADGVPLDDAATITMRVVSLDGVPAGRDVAAVAVRPPDEGTVSFVAVLDVPSPGRWRLDLADATGATGSLEFTAMDPGATAGLGGPAPELATPTLSDVAGVALAVTTVRDPDLRLSQTSTAEARAKGSPYVLLIDSARFETTPACGRALTIVQYLVERWPDVTFIHLEPYEYTIVNGEPILGGTLTNPPLNRYSRAWGMGEPPWPPVEQPWMFVVDESGVVRAKYTGIMGSADVDVILAMLAAETGR